MERATGTFALIVYVISQILVYFTADHVYECASLPLLPDEFLI